MATLAEELLNDFDDFGDGEEELPLEEDDVEHQAVHAAEDQRDSGEPVANFRTNGEQKDTEMFDVQEGPARVREVKTLDSIREVLDKIAQYESNPPPEQIMDSRSITEDDQYLLLQRANGLYASIDDHISILHKSLRDHYSKKYPELETLVTNPTKYATAARIIGNADLKNFKDLADMRDNSLGLSLRDILDPQTIFVVSTEAIRSRGQDLSASEWRRVVQDSDEIMFLEQSKSKLLAYVESRLFLFAPNLAKLIGPVTAAQLINSCGGLAGLATKSSRNLPSLGSRHQVQTGLARNFGRQRGFLAQSEIFKFVSDDYLTKALRVVSAKVILAVRHDLVRSSPDGKAGEDLQQEVLAHLDKISGPPPNRGPKALPAPDDKPSRKRGGKKIRKMKEATAMTDMAKARNRMAFGKEEQEVGYGTGEGTSGMGMIGQDNDGRIRAMKVDQRTAAKLSKKNKGWGVATPLGGTVSSLGGFGQGAGNASVLRAHGLRSSGVGGQTAGTASSIAFTPVQGLELVNPEAQKELKRKRAAEEDRWFKGGTFTQVGGGSVLPPSSANGGFKVPPLPTKAKANGDMGPPPPKRSA